MILFMVVGRWPMIMLNHAEGCISRYLSKSSSGGEEQEGHTNVLSRGDGTFFNLTSSVHEIYYPDRWI